jgi:hypothetical protein
MSEQIKALRAEIKSIGRAYLTDFEVLNTKCFFNEDSEIVWEALLESCDGSRFLLERDTEGETFIDKVPF